MDAALTTVGFKREWSNAKSMSMWCFGSLDLFGYL